MKQSANKTPPVGEDEREYLEERAAIAEYDAEMTRQEAEEWALECLRRRREREEGIGRAE